MSEALILGVGVVLGWLLAIGARRSWASAGERRSAAPSSGTSSAPSASADSTDTDATGAHSNEGGVSEVYALAAELLPFYDQSAHPSDVAEHELFAKAVTRLLEGKTDEEQLVGWAAGDNAVLSCLAFEALRRREEELGDATRVADALEDASNWSRYFGLRLLREKGGAQTLGTVLANLDLSWSSSLGEQLLTEHLLASKAALDDPSIANTLGEIDRDVVEWLRVEISKKPGLEALAQRIEEARRARIDTEFLRSFGRVHAASDLAANTLPHPSFDASVAELVDLVSKDKPRSQLVVGDRGVGKTSVLRSVAKTLQERGWTIFEADASAVLAGQSFVGQVEQRIQTLVENLRGTKAVWIIPDFQELAWAGRTTTSPTSLLDLLLPAIQAREILVLGECQSDGLERLAREKPQIRTMIEVSTIKAIDDGTTLDLARKSLARDAKPLLDDDELQEAFSLVRQFLGEIAAPGNLLGVLERLRETCERDEELHGREALLVTLSNATGLPRSVLDDSEQLELGELRTFFLSRVLGQREAVDCLVDRIAMIKAGLTDPRRPQGVFLFTGPTGTGKTELARTLAEYLFGSPERMIRLDMSELQAGHAIPRLLGDGDASGQRVSLTSAIRKQPFSVVLLDEIEKADASVWDLFLQVFDAGRLGDAQGRTADFRHAIFVLTSNVGAEQFEDGVGFGRRSAATSGVVKSLERLFRAEFLNRLDRIVVFQPLSRPVMREILRKELDRVLELRGLRQRQWAIEWDESAIDFLLERGFDPKNGARPLRRAIDRYVLAPLAKTIVAHEAPEGDQFLFLRAHGDRIDAVFIDPDAGEGEASQGASSDSTTRVLDLPTLVLDAKGSGDELELLDASCQRLSDLVESDEWQARRERCVEAMAGEEFWESDARFETLALLELIDRIQTGLETAAKLLRRLHGGARSPAEIARRLAERLFLLEHAIAGLENGEPQDAFLRIEALPEPRSEEAANAFADELAGMYGAWAKQRGMRCLELERVEDSPHGQGLRLAFAVSGYASHALLRDEHGLHVRELGEGNTRGPRRARARVTVVGQPLTPARGEELKQLAQRSLDASPGDPTRIVRRYRSEPSPLVRDAVRGWRSGRLDLVLAGHFDVLGAKPATSGETIENADDEAVAS